MMNFEKYRTSTEYREILRILQKATTLQENILWQSHALGKTIIPVQYLEIDFIGREVLVNFNSEHHRIDAELPLYVKIGYRMSVFKVTQFRQNQDSLTFSFPDLIKTKELRFYPRNTFSADAEKYVTLRSSTLKENRAELKVRAINISETGLGLIISEQNRSFLKNNKVLWIAGLQDSELEKPILAEVMYINSELDSKFQIKKQKLLKVGLKVSSFFPEVVYRRFLQ